MSNSDALVIHEHILRAYQTRTLVGEDGIEHGKGYSSAGADARIDESFTYGKAKNRPSIRAYQKPLTDVAEDDSFNLPFAPLRGEIPEDIVRRRVSDLSREALVELSKGQPQNARKLLIRALRF